MKIDASAFWVNVAVLAVGTVSIRGSIISISSRLKISERMKELFSFIPAAILPALLTPMIFFHSGSVTWLGGKERLAVALVTAGVTAYTRSTLWTMLFGMAALACLTI